MSNIDNGYQRIYSNKHIVFVIAFAISCVTFAQELRTWTGSNGSTLQATFVREDGEQVVLLTQGGRKIETRRSSLSTNDHAYIDQYLMRQSESNRIEQVRIQAENALLVFVTVLHERKFRNEQPE